MTLSNTYNFVKPFNASALAIAGIGLFFAEGENHRRQRKMMNPAFTYSNVKVIIFHCKFLILNKVNVFNI